MNVHIVCVDDKWIVPRMSRWLVDAFGWSLSAKPRDDAGINLFMPYTSWAEVDTLTAAWFTHYESANTDKTDLWQRARIHTDLRLTTSPLYFDALSDTGRTSKITPGIDLDHFVAIGKLGRPGRIGFAGIASPRKQPNFARRLSLFGADVVAAGTGWIGVPTWSLSDAAMPGFYQALDIFACASLEEGIPAPVLEALACGTKVVIPTGVGICDELPEAPGVRHFDPDDFDSFLEAIDLAFVDRPDRRWLTELAFGYSIYAWCLSIRSALEVLLSDYLDEPDRERRVSGDSTVVAGRYG